MRHDLRPTVVLNMIVRNEAPVIHRCLDSVRGLVDAWVIVDTGSTDGTQDAIRGHMAAQRLPGELHERPWQDFAHNRSEALTLARQHADYTLLLDADDMLRAPPGYEWPMLTADAYRFEFVDGGVRYQRPCLVRNAVLWRYEGVLHEFLTGGDGNGPTLSGAHIERTHDGARARDPQKFYKDAAVLEKALETERDPMMVARYRFYLAQSYRDAGEREKAVEQYLMRATLGQWREEVCVSLYQAARLKKQLGCPDQDVLDLYARAFMVAPTRAEGLHGAAQVSRVAGDHAGAYHLARLGLQCAMPGDALFVEPHVYRFDLLDEVAINGYWAGHNKESLIACVDLMLSGNCPNHEWARVADNARHALRRICERPAA